MIVSVIITTKNEEKNIEKCLQSLRSQTYKKELIETIVVDNNSSDATKEIASRFADKVYDKGPERSAQRNFGVERSSGSFFLYLDADMILHKDVINDCVSVVNKNNDIIALYISEIVTGEKYFSKVRRFERSFYDATVIDCARFIRKDIFLKVGGFDETLTGPEDWDLDKKLRNVGKIGYVKTPIFHNEEEFNLRKYLRKKDYYAQKFDTYIAKWGKNDPDIRKQFDPWYRLVWVFIEDGKWKKIVAHPVLACGMLFLRVMVGVRFLFR